MQMLRLLDVSRLCNDVNKILPLHKVYFKPVQYILKIGLKKKNMIIKT